MTAPALQEAPTWIRLDRAHGDPIWCAKLGPLHLRVVVGCPWIWEWSIEADDESDIARGTVCVSEDGDALDGSWDYQHVEAAQNRCEVVGHALYAYEFHKGRQARKVEGS